MNSDKFPIQFVWNFFYKVLELERERLKGNVISANTIRQVFEDIVTPANIVRLNQMKHNEAMARKAEKLKG